MNDSNSARLLQAGTGTASITPQAGEQLGGHIGMYRPAQIVLDPLYAKALILESSGRRICIVSLDLVIITKKYCDMIREGAIEFGFETSAVMIHAIQTHSAPGLGYFMADDDLTNIPPELDWIRGNGDEYSTFVVERAIDAIRAACASMQTVQMGVGSGIEGRLAFNRRAINRDGSISMPHRGNWLEKPLGPTDICYIEGPIDPEVGAICFRDNAMNMVSMLANYTCHPVHVFSRQNLVSADWPGAMADEICRIFGKDCVPLVVNGCCGNINPWPPFEPDYVDNHSLMGSMLAKMAGKIVEEMDFRDEAVIDYKTKHIQIPFRQIDADELEETKKMLSENPEPLWSDEHHTMVEFEWMKAVSVYSVYLQQQREKTFDYEIQIMRIGDAVIVGLPGEPFVEGQLRIKMASPVRHTYVAHMINQYVGYIPIKEAVARGGHEASTRYWAKLIPEALDMIVETATQMLEETFKGTETAV